MASLLEEKVFDSQGPSPSKDFFQLIITKNEVIWRAWKISLRIEFRGAAPTELESFNDFYMTTSYFWEQTMRTHCADFTPEMEDLAIAMGWRKTYFTFFYKKDIKQKLGDS
ncbi:LOW QUALITY PROTEIN: F-box only protein 36a [Polymixia lowei]